VGGVVTRTLSIKTGLEPERHGDVLRASKHHSAMAPGPAPHAVSPVPKQVRRHCIEVIGGDRKKSISAGTRLFYNWFDSTDWNTPPMP